MAYLIVLGNEKGGSGKSTTAMHVLSALLRTGQRVGALDLDLRQRSLGRYIENRRAFIARSGTDLPMPEYFHVEGSTEDSQRTAQSIEEERFAEALATLDANCNFVVIDCPGSDSRYARMAHSAADTLITPMNDSLIDFDLLARLDPDSGKVLGPSVYSEMVWQARQLRARAGLKPIDWVVLRNRIGTTNMRNKRRVGDALAELAKRIGFRLVPGFGERVVFRELFLHGLTLLDIRDADVDSIQFNMSNIAARQELRDLVNELRLPGINVDF